MAPQPHTAVRLSRLSRPIPPAVQPLPLPNLGFLPEETGEEAPRSRRQGCGREGEAGNATTWAIFGPFCHPGSRNGHPGGRRSHSRGWCLPEHLTCGCPAPPVQSSITPKAVLANISPQPMSSIRRLPCPNPCDLPHSTANPWQGLRSRVPTSPMGTQCAPGWPLNHCWLLSHLVTSPGALCQQMHRKHLFPTQGELSRGGGAGLEVCCCPHHAGLNSITPGAAAPAAPLPIVAEPQKWLWGLEQPATALCISAGKAMVTLENSK